MDDILAPISNLGPIRALIVDDEPLIANLCGRILEQQGFYTLVTTHPHQALAILEEQKFDLLVTDLLLPEMNGFQLLEITRKRWPEVAVVIITSLGDLKTALEALRRGADGLLLKPFDVNTLVDGVQHALQSRRQKQIGDRIHTMQSLLSLTRALFAEKAPQRVEHILLEQFEARLACQAAAIYHCGKQIRSSGDNKRLPELDPDFAEGPRCKVFEEPGLYYQQHLLPHFTSEEDPALYNYLPLSEEDQLELGQRPGPAQQWSFLVCRKAEFSPAEVELFQLLAEQGAAALENARLHASLQASLRRLADSQQALVNSEKLAVAGRMMASLAHEINNPLQGLKNCLHLAGDERLAAVERAEWLEMARSETERLSNTVERMLAYYRPEQSDQRLLDVNALLLASATLLRAQVEQSGLMMEVSPAKDLPLVFGVRDQLQQVFLNLILNAIEALPRGRQLNLLTRRVEPAENSSHAVTVEVIFEDNGPGIAEEQRRHLFEPFNSSKVQGLGLGLSISYGIIVAHGGQIELRPKAGGVYDAGACFVISLPAGQVS